MRHPFLKRRMSDPWTLYRYWLLDRIDFDVRCYEKLTEFLHDQSFVWSIPMDVNREEDGLYLRQYFFDEYDDLSEYECEVIEDHDCSVLEMLVALAEKMERDWGSDPDKLYPDKQFMEFLTNLNLHKYEDRLFNSAEVDEILGIWLERLFDFRGRGSIFPLKKTPKRDQRTIEIRDQMMDYINQKRGWL